MRIFAQRGWGDFVDSRPPTDNLLCLPVLTLIAKRPRELSSWRRRRWTRALRRRSRDGPLLRFRGQPLAFTRQQLEFAGKRNSGWRTEATAVALKLRITFFACRRCRDNERTGTRSASMHYSRSNFGDHHYGNNSNNECDPQPPSRWFGNSGL